VLDHSGLILGYSGVGMNGGVKAANDLGEKAFLKNKIIYFILHNPLC
jgi:hypothetical protein